MTFSARTSHTWRKKTNLLTQRKENVIQTSNKIVAIKIENITVLTDTFCDDDGLVRK